jgi:hypothetical protein
MIRIIRTALALYGTVRLPRSLNLPVEGTYSLTHLHPE